VLRPFNTYGPRQSARAVIPTIITQALESSRIRLGSLDPRRDLTFVTDTARGFIAAATAPDAPGRTVQLGTGESVSVGEIVDLVGDLLGSEITVETDEARVRPEKSEVQLLLSAPELARDVLGWEPQVGLRAGLEQTIEWIREHRHRYRSGEYAI